MDVQSSLMIYYEQNKGITDGYKLTCQITTSGSKNQDLETINVNVYKIGSKWYLLYDF